jgi:hypothetical protein
MIVERKPDAVPLSRVLDVTRAIETVATVERAEYLIGEGMRLRVPHGCGLPVLLVEGCFDWGLDRPPMIVSSGLASVLMRTLYLLVENRVNERCGWRELGYDGDVADWYAHWC